MQAIPIFLATDNNYASLAAVTMTSVCANTRRDVHFYVINNGISDAAIEKIMTITDKFKHATIQFIQIDAKQFFHGMKLWEHVSIMTFARLLIPWLVQDVNKALYMDVDTIAVGDVGELYDIDLGKYAIGAAKCIEIDKKSKFYGQIYAATELAANHVYFQAGILLMDCAKWRADKKLPDGFWEIEKKYPNRMCADQCILNKYFENNYMRIPQKFNVSACRESAFDSAAEYNDVIKNIVIRHFIGADKAHNSASGIATEHLPTYYKFWEYAAQTPFFAEMLMPMMRRCFSPWGGVFKSWIKLFGLIPILKKRGKRILLFGVIPLLSIEPMRD